jgi:2-hydroxy-3-keto-5-methylthiopentenyl-1-phosphate phosphatase
VDPQVTEFGADMRLDPGFKEFYQFCKDNDIPFIIVSR